jgi:hypothetical protein
MKRCFILSVLILLVVFCGVAVGPARAGTTTGLPLGPAFGPSPQLALTDGTVDNNGTDLVVTLNFSTTISPPASGAANSVFGDVLLDTDQSTATGLPVTVGGSLDSSFGLGLASIPSAQIPNGLGVDYVVDLDSVGGAKLGDVDVISTTSLNTLISVPITYTSNSLSFSIPISALTDPVAVHSYVNFGAIVGNPNGSTDTLLGINAIPEPSTLGMASVACLGVACFVWARRRSPTESCHRW